MRQLALPLLVVLSACGGGEDPADGSGSVAVKKKTAVKNGPAAPAGWRKNLKGVPIPTNPIRAQLVGRALPIDHATYNAQMSTLVLGKLDKGSTSYSSRHVTAFLFLRKSSEPPAQTAEGFRSSLPLGKTVDIEPDEKMSFGKSIPHMHVWDKPGQRMQSEIHTDGYAMRIAFGDALDAQLRLQGRIYLCLPPKGAHRARTLFVGAFAAKLEGTLLWRDGKPVLNRDDAAILRFVATRAVAEKEGELTSTKAEHWSFSHPGKQRKPQWGRMDLHFVRKDKSKGVARVQLAKDKPEADWRFVRSLELWQLHEAHPTGEPPTPKNTSAYLGWILAKKLEQELAEASKKQAVTWYSSSAGYGKTAARVRINYKLGDAKDYTRRRFAFLKKGDDWELLAELKPDEKLDFRSGKIVPKK